MKSILVPTDFSETSINALEYAAAFASRFNASLLLFHAYHIPVLVSEVPFTTTQEDLQLEEIGRGQLELIRKDIKDKYQGKVPVEVVASPALAVDEIASLAKEKACDLIIMGTRGVVNRGIWGSNSAQVVKNTKCDVLIVPDGVCFEPIDKIAFAFDYKAVENITAYKGLIEIARLFQSEILIFNMEDSRNHPAKEKQAQGLLLEDLLGNIKHSYWFSEQQNIADALNHFAENNSAAMICMVRREHSLFQFLFKQSNTRQMALHTRFPLLVLHDRNDLQ